MLHLIFWLDDYFPLFCGYENLLASLIQEHEHEIYGTYPGNAKLLSKLQSYGENAAIQAALGLLCCGYDGRACVELR